MLRLIRCPCAEPESQASERITSGTTIWDVLPSKNHGEISTEKHIGKKCTFIPESISSISRDAKIREERKVLRMYINVPTEQFKEQM